MVKKLYQADDGSLFDTMAKAVAHEVIKNNRPHLEAKLASFGLDAAGVSVVLQNAYEVYEMFHDLLDGIHEDKTY